MPRHLISDAHEWINEIPTVPRFPLSPIPTVPLSLLFFSLPGAILVSPPCYSGFYPPERRPELLSVSPWEMDPDPVPPPVILAIPAPSSPLKPSSSSSISAPPPSISDQFLPAPSLSGAVLAPTATPAGQFQCAALPSALPAGQVLSAATSSPAEPSPPCISPAEPTAAMPSSPPAAPPSAPPAAPPVAQSVTDALPSSASPPLSSSFSKSPSKADAPLSAKPADLQQRPQPVRRNAQADPLLPKSYAQAAKGSPGPGFVRAHAHDVDSFARLPRTGINAIRGSREGVPTFAIAQSDLPKVEGLYAKALVMKFHGGRPSLAASHKEISNWGLESPFSIGPLTSRSFLLRFQNERDLLKTLTRPSSTLIKFPYKIFRWHSRCHIKEESCVVPIWISLPRLPLQFFAPELLESIANSIGRFLCLDKATATLARPSEARMCVELDLRKERLQFIWIDLFEGFKQPIVYERVPKFCIGCHVQGHTHVECSKSSLDTPQPQDSGPFPAVQECPQPVRRNDKELSAADSHDNQSRASSFAAATDPLLSSDRSQQDLPQPIVAAASSEQPLCDPPPHPPLPSHPPLPATAQHLPAVQPHRQSTVAAAPHSPLIPPPSIVEEGCSPDPFPAAVQPHLQSSVAAATHPPLFPPSNIEAISSPALLPSSTVFPAQNLPAVQHNLQPTVAAATHPPLSSSSPSPVAADPPTAQDPCPSTKSIKQRPSKQVSSSSLNNQSSSPSLRVYYNKHGRKFMTVVPQPGRPLWEMVNCNQGHLSSIINAPSPSSNLHQIHALEGDDSEVSFETDSQQNSPSGSPLKEAIQSEGEELTEDHPGFLGHNSDVDFYHRPRSSKKNKRQPDGPLRVQLRARKGPSSRK